MEKESTKQRWGGSECHCQGASWMWVIWGHFTIPERDIVALRQCYVEEKQHPHQVRGVSRRSQFLPEKQEIAGDWSQTNCVGAGSRKERGLPAICKTGGNSDTSPATWRQEGTSHTWQELLGSPFHLLGLLFSLTDSLQFLAHKDKRKLLPTDFPNHGPQPAKQLRNDRVRQRGHCWGMDNWSQHSCSPVVFFLLSALSSATRSTKNSFLPSACKELPLWSSEH